MVQNHDKLCFAQITSSSLENYNFLAKKQQHSLADGLQMYKVKIATKNLMYLIGSHQILM